MDYIKLILELEPKDPYTEILISELSDLGFESFVETEKGVEAFIPESEFDKPSLSILEEFDECSIGHKVERIPFTNWNAKWESDFQPVIVGKRCIVRAPFHEAEEGFEYDIIIQPQMSFGTGHHATTSLMIQFILNMELKDKKVLDLGSGTGVLAILAEKKGAKNILATDIEDYIVQNTKENIALNGAVEIDVKKADVMKDRYRGYDLILANINLNVLLQGMKTISEAGKPGSKVLMSGFFLDDFPVLEDTAKENGLVLEEVRDQERWASVLFSKK